MKRHSATASGMQLSSTSGIVAVAAAAAVVGVLPQLMSVVGIGPAFLANSPQTKRR